MFPIFGGLFGGLFGASFLSGFNSRPRLTMPVYQWFRNGNNTSGGSGNTSSVYSILDNEKSRYYKTFMTDYKVSPQIFDVIKEWEKYHEKPYYATPNEKERGILTIGYGSIRLFDGKGDSQPVKSTDRVTEKEAIFHMLAYYNSGGNRVKKSLDDYIRKNGIVLHQRMYDMILQWSYVAGSWATAYDSGRRMLNAANRETNLYRLANLWLTIFIPMLKSLKNGRLYNESGLGWSRRVYSTMQYILGGDYSKRTAERMVTKRY